MFGHRAFDIIAGLVASGFFAMVVWGLAADPSDGMAESAELMRAIEGLSRETLRCD